MTTVRVTLTAALALALCGFVAAQDKKADPKKFDAAKLVGTWEQKKEKSQATLVFDKDGKLKMMAGPPGMEVTLNGTYKLDGDKLSVTMKIGDMDKKQDMTVLKLDDKELTTKDDKGKEDTFTRKK